MGRTLLFVSLAVGAAAISTSAVGIHQPPSRHPKVRHDSRRLGPGTHRAGPAELAVRNRVAREEQLKIEARKRQHAISVPSTTWVSLGPTDATREFNGVDIDSVDSGRPNQILVDPRDPNVVYMAVSGGGLWKAFDFLSAGGPTWNPATDTQPNLAIGALAFDDTNADVLYLGAGDFIDGSGNTVLKSSDGGGTWTAPLELSGMYPNGFAGKVKSIRSIAAHDAQVMVGTDVGLFASTDGGATFALVDLPNKDGMALVESLWTVIHLGNNHWVASGVTACDPQSGPAPLAFGSDPGGGCAAGNNAEIWISGDGATWTLATLPMASGTGRVTIAAGRSPDPTQAVLYGYVGATDNFSTLGFWRSNDGGATWADATGTLANPTLPVDFGGGVIQQDCEGMDLAHSQAWYNQSIVVDPTNPNNVLIGGNLCGARTLNGMSASPTWELVSHWLPNYDGGKTANGRLPYVHADWHTSTSVVDGSTVRTFAGTDGGIFSSTDLFKAAQPEHVTWVHHNRGLVTHLFYALASGDPVTSNAFVLFGGLQDNGTRFRLSPDHPSVFNQPVGGDGIGGAVHVASSGTTYWSSVEFAHVFCRPAPGVDCAQGENWGGVDPILAEEDEFRRRPDKPDPRVEDDEPFLVHFANVETDTVGQSVLTHTEGEIFVSEMATDGTFSFKAISQDILLTNGSGFSSVTASRTIPGLYGGSVNTSARPFYVSTTGNTLSTWVVAQPVHPTGNALRLTGASSIDFPPVTPAGKAPGQVYIGSFSGTLNDAAQTPPPDEQGHLYRTTDGGQTWTSIVGADPAHRLPNVAVYVAKYDPMTPTTIYAGTDVGVYFSTDDGATWNRMGDNFPIVPVRDIYVAKNQDFIRVATYGRGVWEIYPSADANPGAPGNGDYDRNLRIDWVDVAALSSRLGDTPATQVQPFYSWIMDVVPGGPPIAKIDDDDLAALLAKFGGHP
jgi:photosystem II stability/assembly factor-like uncharacterized protein